jgi:hypothetical protein
MAWQVLHNHVAMPGVLLRCAFQEFGRKEDVAQTLGVKKCS